MADRPGLQHRREQIEQRIAERRAALLARLECIAQVQAKGRPGIPRNLAVPHAALQEFLGANCTRGAAFGPATGAAQASGRLRASGVLRLQGRWRSERTVARRGSYSCRWRAVPPGKSTSR